MSWGYKLTVTFIVFAAMMGYMVYRSFGSNFELVEKEYYKTELRYQETIDGKANVAALSQPPIVHQQGQHLQLQLPPEMKDQAVAGKIVVYCAYDASKDRQFALATDNNGTQLFAAITTPGVYTVKLSWQANGKWYYNEQPLTLQ